MVQKKLLKISFAIKNNSKKIINVNILKKIQFQIIHKVYQIQNHIHQLIHNEKVK